MGKESLYNFAEDNALSAFASSIKELIRILEKDSEIGESGLMKTAEVSTLKNSMRCGRYPDLHK